jgi:hypothetical protein
MSIKQARAVFFIGWAIVHVLSCLTQEAVLDV